MAIYSSRSFKLSLICFKIGPISITWSELLWSIVALIVPKCDGIHLILHVCSINSYGIDKQQQQHTIRSTNINFDPSENSEIWLFLKFCLEYEVDYQCSAHVTARVSKIFWILLVQQTKVVYQ